MHEGKPINDMDLAIASIALSQGFTLVTHNTRHFKNIPELLLEDWEKNVFFIFEVSSLHILSTMKIYRIVFVFSLLIFLSSTNAGAYQIINDITQLNPIPVAKVLTPHSIQEIQEAVKNHPGPISIGGGRFSMGGQTATEESLFLDMRDFNEIVDFSSEQKTITVQSGCTWRQIQEHIDPFDLSVKIMQSFANFTVGGSLSVNAHGRYVGLGPLVLSVKSIKLILADGLLVEANPNQNKDIFYGAIGGYGGLGVIVEATLDLAQNSKIENHIQKIPVGQYKNFFLGQISNDPKAIFHNGDLKPPDYDWVNSITWTETTKPLTISDHLRPLQKKHWVSSGLITLFTNIPLGNWLRSTVVDPLLHPANQVAWRNYEASYDVQDLEPVTRKYSTYVLQEYFVPIDRFDNFVPKMQDILKKFKPDILNVSIRHSLKDPGTLLAWAKTESFSLVVYYKQGVSEKDKKEVGIWTRELIDAALSVGGSYYLPYQIVATDQQFHTAYPHAGEFFTLKKKLDPTNKFRNKLWDRYYMFLNCTKKSYS